MSDSIRSILERLALIENQITPVGVKHGLNAQQKSVHQLPALFKPKSISTVLDKKTDPTHPMHKELVGDSILPSRPGLAETMAEIDEDMLSKVKRGLIDYLEQLEDKVKTDRELSDKAVDAVDRGEAEESYEMSEDPTTQDPVVNIPTPPIQDPVLPESRPVKSITCEDGNIFEIHGDEHEGFDIRHNGRSLPTRFPNINHADMAVRIFQNHRKKSNLNQDYLEEQ